MDALDAMILRELGIEPFTAWPRRHVGLRLSDVARRLGRNVQFVKDRIQRMEADGVIAGYRLFPNLRHVGLDYSVYHLPAAFVPDRERMSRLDAVDGFCGVVWFLDAGLCINLSHGSRSERDRRLRLITDLVGTSDRPRVLYHRAFPEVPRRLTTLDWRIVQAMEKNARRPLQEVADELGVTAKTVRTRFHAMWDEGSVDSCVMLDFERLSGMIPFQLAVWLRPDETMAEAALLDLFQDRYIDHFRPPPEGYGSLLLRIFAYTPAEVQALVREALAVDGVEKAEVQLATGGHYPEEWLRDLIGRQVQADAPRLP